MKIELYGGPFDGEAYEIEGVPQDSDRDLRIPTNIHTGEPMYGDPTLHHCIYKNTKTSNKLGLAIFRYSHTEYGQTDS